MEKPKWKRILEGAGAVMRRPCKSRRVPTQCPSGSGGGHRRMTRMRARTIRRRRRNEGDD